MNMETDFWCSCTRGFSGKTCQLMSVVELQDLTSLCKSRISSLLDNTKDCCQMGKKTTPLWVDYKIQGLAILEGEGLG